MTSFRKPQILVLFKLNFRHARIPLILSAAVGEVNI